jgi:UDPglucose 6-dehydrogenase
LATKISFINAVANICKRTGANIRDVSYGTGLDKRIGRSFLEAGIGFGVFFLKDLQAFIRIAEKCCYDFNFLKEVEQICPIAGDYKTIT